MSRRRGVSLAATAHRAPPGSTNQCSEIASERWYAGYPETVPGPGYRFVSRGIDIVVSVALLTLISPLMLAIAIWIRRDSPDPALFRQLRVAQQPQSAGRRAARAGQAAGAALEGKLFALYKFRTMYADAMDRFPQYYRYEYSSDHLRTLPIKALPSSGTGSADTVRVEPGGDMRLTRVGCWLRRTSLDELPNLVNVLKGDMALVGPRPDIAQSLQYYLPEHYEKFDVKPGLTGLAQVCGRGNLSFHETNTHDVEYVRRQCLRLDIEILLRTPLQVLRGNGAY